MLVDMANVYRDARRAFHGDTGPASLGQVDPFALASLLAGKGPADGIPRRLEQVLVCTGVPSQKRSPETYSAHLRQRQAWEDAGAKVLTTKLSFL